MEGIVNSIPKATLDHVFAITLLPAEAKKISAINLNFQKRSYLVK